MTKPLSILAAALLTGCVSVQPQLTYTPHIETTISPAPGEVHEVTTGQELARQTRVSVRDTIYVRSALAISGYTIAPGHFKKVGESEQGDFFLPTGGGDGGSILPRQLVDPPQGLLVRRDGGALCVLTVYGFLGCTRPDARVTAASAEGYERRSLREPASDSPEQSLTYVGRKGSRVSFLSRKASPGQAPNESTVEHDLSTSPMIDYKDMHVEVLEATPQSIRYRMILRAQP